MLSLWYRPLHAMADAFTGGGSGSLPISDPPPAPSARELLPDVFEKRASGAFPCFLFFVLQAD
ncbi:hypothetical protein [Pseudonocardia humida]|uniref:hypothetical protein n=1 Tax=Pseudonocardia humida TaxID=2800819 RepID=UPI00207D4819|nr:hypothetical protein [Pseudonocardia humida]